VVGTGSVFVLEMSFGGLRLQKIEIIKNKRLQLQQLSIDLPHDIKRDGYKNYEDTSYAYHGKHPHADIFIF